jgi:hypothetical protein
MSVVDAVRERLGGTPTRYERAWLVSINAVGLVVVLGVLLDSALVLGRGEQGIYQRALYPLVPPAVSLGVALAERYRRGTAVAAGVALLYVLALAGLGTLGSAVADAPAVVAGGAIGLLVLTAGAFLWARAAGSEQR